MGDSGEGRLSGRFPGDQWCFLFDNAAGVFETTPTTRAQAHLLGNVVQRHAFSQAFLELAAIHVFADTNDHVAYYK